MPWFLYDYESMGIHIRRGAPFPVNLRCIVLIHLHVLNDLLLGGFPTVISLVVRDITQGCSIRDSGSE